MKIFVLLSVFFLVFSCNRNDSNNTASIQKVQRPVALENGKFFNIGDQKMLYGGEDTSHHFNISNMDLKIGQFHYGIGRERFPALIKPEFISVEEADKIWNDTSRFLLAYSGDDVKAYSVKDLTRHEVVNDLLNGEPIMAVYCILADLGAVYERKYGDQELTFALSGYTYYDKSVWNGLDGFVLWDRETESLWWPLIGKGVSGSLKDVALLEMDKAQWEDTTWKKIRDQYPQAKVLRSGQDYIRPNSWKKLDNVSSIKANYTLKE